MPTTDNMGNIAGRHKVKRDTQMAIILKVTENCNCKGVTL